MADRPLSPVWDTGLALHALLEAGHDPAGPVVRGAADWLRDRQILDVKGDWAANRRNVRPGGWAFQYRNDYYPDVDDSAVVIMALHRIDKERYASSIARGTEWILGMQSANGGWGAFDADNVDYGLDNIPFADHGALLDPSTEDLTGRGLELMGTVGYGRDFEPARRALAFLRHRQRHDGPWFGRWGVNYIYGTWSVLRGLAAIGENLDQEYVQRAVRWLEARQNLDSGWGETCESYDRPELAGIGPSTPSQTAWALLALLAAGRARTAAVERGVHYLLDSQRADGGWVDQFWNGTGFPGVFMLQYHLYASYFPLWALGVYQRALDG